MVALVGGVPAIGEAERRILEVCLYAEGVEYLAGAELIVLEVLEQLLVLRTSEELFLVLTETQGHVGGPEGALVVLVASLEKVERLSLAPSLSDVQAEVVALMDGEGSDESSSVSDFAVGPVEANDHAHALEIGAEIVVAA